MDINIDTYDWQKNKHVAIINGKLMDRRLMGGDVIAPGFRFARNAKYCGTGICPVCGERFTKTRYLMFRGNHNTSKAHLAALNGVEIIKKRTRQF